MMEAGRRLGVRETLVDGFKLLVDHPVVLVPFVVLFAVEIILGLAKLGLLTWLIEFFATPLVVGMTVVLSYDALRQEPPVLGLAFNQALARYGSLLGASILYGLAIGLGTLFFIIPGIIFYIRLIFYPQALMIDNELASSALRSSWELTRGRFWPLFFISLTQLLAAIPASLFGGLGALALHSWVYSSFTIAYLRLREPPAAVSVDDPA